MENSSHDLMIWNVDTILLILVFLIPIQSEVWGGSAYSFPYSDSPNEDQKVSKKKKKIKKKVKFCYSSEKEKLKLLIMKKKNQVR